MGAEHQIAVKVRQKCEGKSGTQLSVVSQPIRKKVSSFVLFCERTKTRVSLKEITNRMMKGGDEIDSFLRFIHSPFCLSSDRMNFADFYIKLFQIWVTRGQPLCNLVSVLFSVRYCRISFTKIHSTDACYHQGLC